MDIKTKFNLDDEVYTLHTWEGTERERCDTCQGSARVRVHASDLKARCPSCDNGWVRSVARLCVAIADTPDAIGMIQVQTFARKEGVPKARRGKQPEKYMLYGTGIESGTLFKVEDLFTTREEAVAEGKKRVAAWKRKQKKG